MLPKWFWYMHRYAHADMHSLQTNQVTAWRKVGWESITKLQPIDQKLQKHPPANTLILDAVRYLNQSVLFSPTTDS